MTPGRLEDSGNTALEWGVEKGKGRDTKEPHKGTLETDQKRMRRESGWRKKQVSEIMLGQGEAGARARWFSPPRQPGSPGESTQNDYGYTDIKGT